jgi:hypothetical protein
MDWATVWSERLNASVEPFRQPPGTTIRDLLQEWNGSVEKHCTVRALGETPMLYRADSVQCQSRAVWTGFSRQGQICE